MEFWGIILHIGIGTVVAGAAIAATLFWPEKLIIHNSA